MSCPPPDPSREELAELAAAAFLARQQGGSAAWRAHLDAHPTAAFDLQQQLATLQAFGLDPQRGGAPESLGGYTLVRRLGAGGMGVVYLGRDAAGAEAAVKLVRAELLLGTDWRVRFQREIAALAQLRHPGIVRLLGNGEEQGLPWLATEYLPGVSLAERLADLAAVPPVARSARDLWPGQAPLAPSWPLAVAELLAGLADALAHAHAAGVIHRDIKPGNVRLTQDGRAVLIDFGLALPAQATTLTQTGALIGSVHYMAPELLRGGEAGPVTDVHALGVVLYEALTGRQPFAGASFEAVRSQILDGEPVPLRRLHADLPQGLVTVCRKAMEPDPRHRYPTAAAFAADLRRILAGQPPAGRLAPAPTRALRWLRRRPLRGAAIASALALLVVVPMVVFLQQAAALRQGQRLTDLFLVDELVQRERELWPAVPRICDGPDGLRGWLVTAEELLARRPPNAHCSTRCTAMRSPPTTSPRPIAAWRRWSLVSTSCRGCSSGSPRASRRWTSRLRPWPRMPRPGGRRSRRSPIRCDRRTTAACGWSRSSAWCRSVPIPAPASTSSRTWLRGYRRAGIRPPANCWQRRTLASCCCCCRVAGSASAPIRSRGRTSIRWRRQWRRRPMSSTARRCSSPSTRSRRPSGCASTTIAAG